MPRLASGDAQKAKFFTTLRIETSCCAEKEKKGAKTTKKGSSKKGNAKEKAGQDASAEELQQQLAAAEAEAKRLRALVGSKATPKKRKVEGKQKAVADEEAEEASLDPETTEDAAGGEGQKALNHKERKRLQRAAYKVTLCCQILATPIPLCVIFS